MDRAKTGLDTVTRCITFTVTTKRVTRKTQLTKDNGSSGKDTNWAQIATQRRLMPTSITANRARTGPAFVGTSKCTVLHGMVSYLHAKNTTGPTLFTYNTLFTKELPLLFLWFLWSYSGMRNIRYNFKKLRHVDRLQKVHDQALFKKWQYS